MEKLFVKGRNKFQGTVKVYGAKNVALKALVAASLTSEEVVIENLPRLSDVFIMAKIIKELGGKISIRGHKAVIRVEEFKKTDIALDEAAQIRTSSMFIAPLLARNKHAYIPNPGGCRLGARPIDRTIEGLKALNVNIFYDSSDGFFHAKTSKLKGATYRFDKNSHTGTETMLIAAVLAEGTTVLQNAAEEPEVDELINMLNSMGAKIQKTAPREYTVKGVSNLHGTSFTVGPDRNEIVTFAVAALITKGDIIIENAKVSGIKEFLEKVDDAGGGYEMVNGGIRFFYKGQLKSTNVTTAIYPGFMTDWQAPWGALMTQAEGESIIHETVFENKLGYVHDLEKMGAKVKLYNPNVLNPEQIYNFNLEDDSPEYFHAVKIFGPTELHNGVMTTLDLRAGAAVVLAALAARGKTTIFGVDKLDRGYESFEERLRALGADIIRVKEEEVI